MHGKVEKDASGIYCNSCHSVIHKATYGVTHEKNLCRVVRYSINCLRTAVDRNPHLISARASDHGQCTLLLLASKYGSFEKVKFLIEELKADYSYRNDSGDNCFMMALSNRSDGIKMMEYFERHDPSLKYSAEI